MCFLISLVGAVVVVAYLVIIPYELTKKSVPVIAVYLIVGNWILVNTIFHYGRAWTTPPGSPPQVTSNLLNLLEYDSDSVPSYC